MSNILWLKERNGSLTFAPDWVRLPASLGGEAVRVLSVSIEKCPRCPRGANTLELATGVRVGVCRHHENPYCFYTKGAK